MIVTYQKEYINDVWPRVEPFIQQALDRGSIFTTKDVKKGLINSNLQLWTWQTSEIEAVMVTSVCDGTCLVLTMAGKNMKDWLPCLPIVENWARETGCTEMRIQGRKGWSRALGYEIIGRDDLNLYIMKKNL